MSKSVRPRLIGEIVKQHEAIGHLQERALKLQAVQRFIREIPNLSVADHLTVGDIQGDRLVLVADSSAWASKIRYAVPLLLEHFRTNTEYAALRSVRIRVKSNRDAPPSQRLTKTTLSPVAMEELERSAQIMDDQEIAAAMRRIAKNVSRR